MIRPAMAIPLPVKVSGAILILDRAIWPQMIAGMPVIGPHEIIARMPNIRDQIASGESDFMIVPFYLYAFNNRTVKQ